MDARIAAHHPITRTPIAMNDARRSAHAKWAPWWAYLVSILAINYLRQALVPPADVGDAVSVGLFARRRPRSPSP
jgi:hypothetical protein